MFLFLDCHSLKTNIFGFFIPQRDKLIIQALSGVYKAALKILESNMKKFGYIYPWSEYKCIPPPKKPLINYLYSFFCR
jgi:hypothetical protein